MTTYEGKDESKGLVEGMGCEKTNNFALRSIYIFVASYFASLGLSGAKAGPVIGNRSVAKMALLTIFHIVVKKKKAVTVCIGHPNCI